MVGVYRLFRLACLFKCFSKSLRYRSNYHCVHEVERLDKVIVVDFTPLTNRVLYAALFSSFCNRKPLRLVLIVLTTVPV